MTVATAQARKELKAIANAVRGLLALDETLDSIGTLDAMVAEREQRIADLDKLAVAADERLAKADADGDRRRKEIAADLEARQADVTAAEMKAAQIIAQAQMQARDMIAEANATAARTVAETQAIRDGLAVEIVAAQSNLKSLRTQIHEREQRRNAVTEEMARIKRMMTEN